MRKTVPIAAVLALVTSLAAGAAAGHEGEDGEETIAVEPSSATAGDSVVLAGSGLEPNNDRVLVLAGGHLVVEFGTVTTDDEGMFQIELTLPDHLPSGTYELRAIGDEILGVELTITVLPGSEAPPTEEGSQTVVPRQRTPIELGAILAVALAAAAAGALLVWRAEHVRGPASH